MIPLVIISFRCFIYVSIQVIFLPLTKFTECGCVPVANVHKPSLVREFTAIAIKALISLQQVTQSSRQCLEGSTFSKKS